MSLPSAPFNTAKSIFAGLSVIALKVESAITGVTAATTIFTKTAHGLVVGDAFSFDSGTGFTGLVAGTIYYVKTAPDADTFTASATPGGAALSPGTSTVGVITPAVLFESRLLNSKLEQEVKDISRRTPRAFCARCVKCSRSSRNRSHLKWTRRSGCSKSSTAILPVA